MAALSASGAETRFRPGQAGTLYDAGTFRSPPALARNFGAVGIAHVYRELELSGGGGSGPAPVPTTGQIWPRGNKAGIQVD